MLRATWKVRDAEVITVGIDWMKPRQERLIIVCGPRITGWTRAR